jgi:hypothetical protein
MGRWIDAVAGIVFAALGAGSASAAQVDTLAVSHRDNGFEIVFDGVVDAPQELVYAVLSDYARLGKLNPVISAISVETAPNGRGERVRSVIDACVWFFCRQIVQVEDVTEPDPQTIMAHIVPYAGDFQSGSCFWRVTKEGSRTRLHYEATRVAAFWIPPVIGPWVIRRSARQQFESGIAALERAANHELQR